MDTLSDNALMLKVKTGDIEKLGLLYERYNKQLFGFFYRMTGEASISEDLVQNVFYRILKYRKTFTGKGKFVSWMYQMARNVNADQYRKKNPLSKAKDVKEWEGRIQDAGSADQQILKDQELIMLNLALNRLSDDKKEVLVLSRYQELKYQEIAEILSCTEGAVKVRVHRALHDLKNIYLKLEKEGNYEM